ncbi:hypothetical protein BDA99DRAFT_463429 [Phascolomyces articulosus]|uniref:sn-1-specific diacylglycerol lipase n=1 Tax=Phascolomyces articulosus TaxID=60185 RepID=A0AAD5KA46_9FUNG|nr:hypothetical protein BDA99DRAFT_463429 [Phascolomyces articulosus]
MSICSDSTQVASFLSNESYQQLIYKIKPRARAQVWVHARTLSVPDIHQIKKEWQLYQSGHHELPVGKLQIDLLNIRTDTPYKRPIMRVKMGSAQYFSSRSTQSTGDWNEGFVFVVSYHAQLFDTIDLDLYDKPHKYWPSKSIHVGKSKLKLSKLKGKDDIFVTFLPIYEYRTSRTLPEDVRHTIINTNLASLAEASGRLDSKKLIGSVQIRIRYHYQQPSDIEAPPLLTTIANATPTNNNNNTRCYTYNNADDSDDDLVFDQTTGMFPAPPMRRVSHRPDVDFPIPTSKRKDSKSLSISPIRRTPSRNSNSNRSLPATAGSSELQLSLQHTSQHGRGELARDENIVNIIFREKLAAIMNTHVPGSESSLPESKRSSRHRREEPNLSSEQQQQQHKQERQQEQREIRKTKRNSCVAWIGHIFAPKAPNSARGKRYGFSQNDTDDHTKDVPSDHAEAEKRQQKLEKIASHKKMVEELQDEKKGSKKCSKRQSKQKRRRRDRIKEGASRKARHIIDSVNFGDKNFASQWMRDSFDDVAIAHPAFDRLISLVVSSQTRALVRSIMKLANAFGQGFKVTSFQLLKAMITLERYYKSLPRPPPNREIKDRALMDEACHYFDYALMAYGWRGLRYLGSYGQYIREARHPRSNRLAIIRFLNLHPEDLLGYEYGLRKGAVFQPSYYVAIDRSRKAIVLSIRGTWSLYDAITDLVCEYKPFKGGLVHAGMLASAQWFYTNIIPQIFRYIHHHSNELSSFIITGHSLGGGAASLLTMLVSEQVSFLRQLSNNPSFRLHCYSYAPVALSSYELNHKYDDYIHSFICQDDIVGRMSYGTAMELKELIMDTITAYETLGGWHKVMTDPVTRKICFEILTQCRDKMYNNVDQLYPLLYIPGNIVYIRRKREHRVFSSDTASPSRTSTMVSWKKISRHRRLGKKAKSKAKEVSKKIPGATRSRFTAHVGSHSISNEMCITKSCIEDHMLGSYQTAFDQLRATYGQP